PSSNLNTSSNTGAPGSVGQLAPSSVGGPGQHGPTSVGLAPSSTGQHGPTSVGGGPTSVGLAPTSVPQQQQQQQNTPQPTSVGPPGGGGGGPTSVGPGPTSVGLHIGSVGTHNPRSVEHPPITYSEYPPRYFDPLTDLKSLILRDLRKSISALNEQIALAAAYVQEQQANEDPVAAVGYNPLSATPHSIINPQSIPPPKSIDGLKSKFYVEDYTNAYLRFFAVCDRIEARVAVLTDSYRYHNRLQKMVEVQTPAQIKSLGYANVLQPCLDSMRTERKRILGTVRELSTSLQEYRKITDEAEYCSLYSRKRRHEDVEDYSDEQELEENEFGELVKKRSKLDEEQVVADEEYKDEVEEENEEEEFEEEVVEVVEYYDLPDTVMEEQKL
uniref:Uncharacterized protein n=1 Tax=Panagrolaimus sp. ES5 TaxID=591445 RepID=A0AC34GCK4_9BILA